jgi:hypothetical protein
MTWPEIAASPERRVLGGTRGDGFRPQTVRYYIPRKTLTQTVRYYIPQKTLADSTAGSAEVNMATLGRPGRRERSLCPSSCRS